MHIRVSVLNYFEKSKIQVRWAARYMGSIKCTNSPPASSDGRMSAISFLKTITLDCEPLGGGNGRNLAIGAVEQPLG